MSTSTVKNLSRLRAHNFQGMKVTPLVDKKETSRIVAYDILFRKNLTIPPSYHKKAYEVIYILAGKGTAHLDGKLVPVKKGHVIFVRPYSWHSFSTRKQNLRVLAFLSPRVDSQTDLYHN